MLGKVHKECLEFVSMFLLCIRGKLLIVTPDCLYELAVRRRDQDGCQESCPGVKLRSQLQGVQRTEGWVSLLCTLHIYMA